MYLILWSVSQSGQYLPNLRLAFKHIPIRRLAHPPQNPHIIFGMLEASIGVYF